MPGWGATRRDGRLLPEIRRVEKRSGPTDSPKENPKTRGAFSRTAYNFRRQAPENVAVVKRPDRSSREKPKNPKNIQSDRLLVCRETRKLRFSRHLSIKNIGKMSNSFIFPEETAIMGGESRLESVAAC